MLIRLSFITATKVVVVIAATKVMVVVVIAFVDATVVVIGMAIMVILQKVRSLGDAKRCF